MIRKLTENDTSGFSVEEGSWYRTTHSEEETRDLGQKLGTVLKPGHVISFSGSLGSGKTTMIKGICAGLDVQETVTSPTFTLINEYSGRVPVYHFDFYRIQEPEELTDLGLEEYFFGDGICLIEWPNVASQWLPTHHLRVTLQWKFKRGWEHKRDITVDYSRG
jgi:tRNA threonylcarbamoyladenosine biosynthesis protein TsaE